MASTELSNYTSSAARALVLLQEREMIAFIRVWRAARDAGVQLPKVEDPSYASLDVLLHHVLQASRFYVTWLCEGLALDAPGIEEIPDPPFADGDVDSFVEHLLERWRHALESVTTEALEGESRPVPWGASYSGDSMLEHAVLHPMRHAFQLAELTKSSHGDGA